MKFIICDNSKRDRMSVICLLNQYMNCHNIEAECLEFSSGEKLIQHMRTHTVDLIFLDIYMEQAHLNGMQTAVELRNNGYTGGLVFISATGDYAVDSYHVHADYYLLKPLTYVDIHNVFSSFAEKNAEKAKGLSPILHITCNHRSVDLPTLAITYVEIYNRILTVHCITKDYYTYETLTSIEEQLNPFLFIRVNRSYIVNMHFIREIQKNRLLLKNDLDISISRHLNKSVHAAYNDFLVRNLWKEDNE